MMKKIFILFLSASFLLVSINVSAFTITNNEQKANNTTQSGRIYGYVAQGYTAGKGIADVKVDLYDHAPDNNPLITVYTSNNGYYEFANLEEGTYIVEITKDGWGAILHSSRAIDIGPGHWEEEIYFVMYKTRSRVFTNLIFNQFFLLSFLF